MTRHTYVNSLKVDLGNVLPNFLFSIPLTLADVSAFGLSLDRFKYFLVSICSLGNKYRNYKKEMVSYWKKVYLPQIFFQELVQLHMVTF